MEDGALGMARMKGKEMAKKQGGSYCGQGPKSTSGSGGLRDSGSGTSSPHTSHDNKMHQQGGVKRAIKSIH